MKLSLNSFNIEGGSIIDFNNKLIKVSSANDDINYSSLDYLPANDFNQVHMKSLKKFINFVLPYISYKDKLLGIDSIKNIETLDGGSFGMTLVLDDFVMKVSRATDSDEKETIVDEIKSLENIFEKYFGRIPYSLNKYLGFISSKKYPDLEAYNTYQGDLNIYANIFDFHSGLFTIHEEQLMEINTRLANDDYLKNDFLDDIVIIFFEKEQMNLTDFIKETNAFPIMQKLSIAYNLFDHISTALQFLHQTKRVMHSDIKPANIVVTRDESGYYQFKLIDFGGTAKINDNGKYGKLNEDGTLAAHLISPDLYQDTRYEGNLSYLYDYQCLIFSVFNFLGIDNYAKDMLVKIDSFYSSLISKEKNIKGKEVINLFISHINSNIPSLGLPNVEDLDINANKYILVLYMHLFSYIKVVFSGDYIDLRNVYK
jgi:serine/threonine protein kinase